MDFSQFIHRESIPALSWLGRRDWIDFGYNPEFESRTIWTRPKKLEITPEEKAKRPKEFWQQVQHLVTSAEQDVVNSFLLMALARSVAGGPKVFQPTLEDCEALENTACTMAFEDYKQPYPVVIIEFPKEYRQKLANLWNVPKGPTHVIVHHEPEKGFITVNAFFDRNNIISHITPARPEYKTIEDAITYNQDKPGVRDTGEDFKVAELAQRLAVNFCMVMVLLGVRQVGPLDPASYEKAKKMAKGNKNRELGQKLINSTMYKVEFIEQKIKLFEEEFVEPKKQNEDSDRGTHASPKPHWRRGHYRQQPCGHQFTLRKLVFIKPILVMAKMFTGDIKDTQVTYKLTNKEKK